jgi:hypothetical protein
MFSLLLKLFRIKHLFLNLLRNGGGGGGGGRDEIEFF